MKEPEEVDFRPLPEGTLALLVACLVGYFLSFSEGTPSHVARIVSITWLIGLATSFLLDLRLGLRNLLRVDVFALLSLYFFTYFEFLFPQSRFDILVNPNDVVTSIHLTLFGLSAIVIGRHIKLGSRNALAFIGNIEMRSRDFLLVYFSAFFLAHLPMWLSVEFNLLRWFEDLLAPRFSKSWSRGRYGDISTLLLELKLLGYLMPPIAGLIFARRNDYSRLTLIFVLLALLVLWFVAFCSGTRNILGVQMAGFLGGYLITEKKLRLSRIVILGGAIGITYIILAAMMLDFRNVGLGDYLEEGQYQAGYKEIENNYRGSIIEEKSSGYFVDYNLWRLSQMVGVFPDVYDFIGWNMPFVALTKPIPRAFWPEKPTNLKVGLGESIGVQGYTIAVTWIGEAYVAGGVWWIVPIGLMIGAFCRFWNHLASYLQSPFPLIVFASGFYAILLLMRSLMFFTTALLPSLALIVMGAVIHNHRRLG